MRPYRTALFENSRWAEFVPRPDDVFVCSPPKCGTTWTQTIIANLFWPDGDLPGPVMQISPWIEALFLPADAVHAMLRAQDFRRVMKSHTPADGIPWFPDAKYVFVARDGRDAFMSLANHMDRMKFTEMLNQQARSDGIAPMPVPDGDLHGYFARWLQTDGVFFETVASYWAMRSDPRLLLVHFNDLKRDLEGEMRRIARHLKIEIPDRSWPALVERCTFESMRENEAMVGDLSFAFEGGTKGFLFKGTNGRWRELLTADELAAYQRRVDAALPAEAATWLERGRLG